MFFAMFISECDEPEELWQGNHVTPAC